MTKQSEDLRFMRQAIKLAQKAGAQGEVPVGAVVVWGGKVIGRGHNCREQNQDPLAHAELIAISKAAKKLGSWRLLDCTLYVTLEPCPMCAGALVNSRVKKVVYGCKDPKAGAIETLYQIGKDKTLNHQLQIVSGVEESTCSHMLSQFFKQLRK